MREPGIPITPVIAARASWLVAAPAPAGETEPAAAAQHVHVIVDEAGRQPQPSEVEHDDRQAGDLDAGLGHGDDAPAGNDQIACA